MTSKVRQKQTTDPDGMIQRRRILLQSLVVQPTSSSSYD